MQDQAISLECQHEHLLKVSRTFALTIPLLPKEVAIEVSNAYLLCRIADTVEDDPKAKATDKIIWLKDFAKFSLSLYEDDLELFELAERGYRLVKDGAKASELALMQDFVGVIKLTRTFPIAIRRVLARGVAILSSGMACSLNGVQIKTLADVDEYCYSVAGVVGELLAYIFALNCKNIDREHLLALSVSFGEGLQLTNILKDRLEDASRGVSFLPPDAKTEDGVQHYVAITKGHLDDALDFILAIPKSELGIRKFCLLNILMAEATVKLMHADPKGVLKITRRAVKTLYVATSICARCNFFMKALYALVGMGLVSERRDAALLRKNVSKWDRESFDILIEDQNDA